ncbi:MAG: ferrochelatase [Alphaproteobacteria bacterium]|nr:ferrochelatase [Alphaproteobacteria bacterium]
MRPPGTERKVKLAVVLFNLGGPDSPDAVEPFLRNLFGDPAILSLPSLFRKPLARFIARRRAPVAREIYAKIGGRSPILEETAAQARALEAALSAHEVRAFIAMRCWKPFSDDTARAVAAWSPDRVVLLPLYPQFSTTTSQSSLSDWYRASKTAGIAAPQSRICCYPRLPGFVDALAALTREALAKARPGLSYRLLLSAHGLPERVIAKGDPYQWQIEQSAAALVERLGITDWTICYQSRVGPLKWIGPSTDAEIRRAGADGKGVVVVPMAFVSEHSETLVELDIEYAKLAQKAGVRDYLRVPTVSAHPAFIAGLAELVLRHLSQEKPATYEGDRICPAPCGACGYPRGMK